jgi:Ca2+-binding EF-hand superfamily protein
MALSNVLLSSRELIEKAFDMIDKDKDGFLDK